MIRPQRPAGRAVVTAVVTGCLLIGTASPQAAVATPADSMGTVASPERTQSFTSFAMGPTIDDREAFDVTAPIVTRAAVRPVDGSIPDAGNFGARHVENCRACSTDHRGTDFATAAGTPIHVVLDGVVEQAGPLGGYGNTVLVRHSSGLATRYAHMSAIDISAGQSVVAGTVLGAVGSTGVSTGPHLHFEVLVNGQQVDPGPWLAARGVD